MPLLSLRLLKAGFISEIWKIPAWRAWAMVEMLMLGSVLAATRQPQLSLHSGGRASQLGWTLLWGWF